MNNQDNNLPAQDDLIKVLEDIKLLIQELTHQDVKLVDTHESNSLEDFAYQLKNDKKNPFAELPSDLNKLLQPSETIGIDLNMHGADSIKQSGSLKFLKGVSKGAQLLDINLPKSFGKILRKKESELNRKNNEPSLAKNYDVTGKRNSKSSQYHFRPFDEYTEKNAGRNSLKQQINYAKVVLKSLEDYKEYKNRAGGSHRMR